MHTGLSQREQEILGEVVGLYLAGGEPVASAAVSRGSRTGLSSASIRNVMAELEAKGFLRQPHTSAGRAPTDLGLRFFVDRCLTRTPLPPEEQSRLRDAVQASLSPEKLLARVSRVLAAETTEVGMALSPPCSQATLQAVHFLPVDPLRVAAVMVTRGGLVESRLLRTRRPFSPEELQALSNFFSDQFGGLTLAEIRRRLAGMVREERARLDAMLAGAVELGSQAVAVEPGGRGEVFVDGAERLFERVDVVHGDAVRRLMAAFVDRNDLLELLDRFLSAEGPQVLVGAELDLGGVDDLSIIVTSYRLATGEVGLVGVIGLKWMNYPHIMPVVDFLGRCVAEAWGVGGAE